MAKKDAKKEAKQAAEPGAWRVLLPVAGAAIAMLGPALALGGKAVRDRREESSRMPGLAIIPIVGGLLAVIGAVAWRNRQRVMELAGDTFATAEEMAGDVTGKLTGEAAPAERATSESSYEAYGLPATQGAPAA